MQSNDLPLIFFDAYFRLSCPTTFEAVFIVPEGRYDPLKNDIVPIVEEDTKAGHFRNHKKLLQYLETWDDVIDQRIIDHLQTKPDSFWQPVNDFKALKDEVLSAQDELVKNRKILAINKEECAQRIKAVQKLIEERSMKLKLKKNLHELRRIKKSHLTAQTMIRNKDYSKAIVFIDQCQKELDTTFRNIRCLRLLGLRLEELKDVVGKLMLEEFIQLFEKEFSARRKYDEDFLDYEEEFTPVILGLLHMRRYQFLHIIYMEVEEAIKAIIGKILKEKIIYFRIDMKLFDPSLEKLAEALCAFTAKDWLTAFTSISTSLHGFCARLETFKNFLEFLAGVSGRDDDVIEHSLANDSFETDSGVDFLYNSRNSSRSSGLLVGPHTTLIKEITGISEHGRTITQNWICQMVSVRAACKSTN